MSEDLTKLADEALMQRAGRGCRECFVVLVRRHQAKLVNFFARLGDSNHAEDLAQETFVRLYRYRKRYRPTARFTTFLYVLARRARVDHVRRQARRRDVLDGFAAEREVSASVRDSAADLAGRAQEALATLSEEMRSVVVLSIFQGLKYREIAEVLGIPVGTVKTRVFHAMRKLREVLADGRTA
jgi:RNA polymerase sigma-70 factor (ECF subfamily)